MICLRWWELIIAASVAEWASEWISDVLHIRDDRHRLTDRLAHPLRRHDTDRSNDPRG